MLLWERRYGYDSTLICCFTSQATRRTNGSPRTELISTKAMFPGFFLRLTKTLATDFQTEWAQEIDVMFVCVSDVSVTRTCAWSTTVGGSSLFQIQWDRAALGRHVTQLRVVVMRRGLAACGAHIGAA
jgi:hypothetical protein